MTYLTTTCLWNKKLPIYELHALPSLRHMELMVTGVLTWEGDQAAAVAGNSCSRPKLQIVSLCYCSSLLSLCSPKAQHLTLSSCLQLIGVAGLCLEPQLRRLRLVKNCDTKECDSVEDCRIWIDRLPGGMEYVLPGEMECVLPREFEHVLPALDILVVHNSQLYMEVFEVSGRLGNLCLYCTEVLADGGDGGEMLHGCETPQKMSLRTWQVEGWVTAGLHER